MFIHDLNCSWLEHPFLHNSFKLRSDRDIEKIKACGIRFIYIDTSQGPDVEDAPTVEDIHLALNERLQAIGSKLKRADTHLVPLEEEISQAKLVYREANTIVQSTLHDCRLGKQVELERLEPIVFAITESIFRNPDAIISMLRIKQADKYTFQHSVSVSALLISFGRALGLERSVIEQAGIGGLLHDIGKMNVPNHILNKPGKLNQHDFSIMKKHVEFGCNLMQNIKDVSPIASHIVAQHHERYDGTGYPAGLKGEEINYFGQMASIVDVYDALTSNRVYHKAIEPTQVLRKLLEWSDLQFNTQLVHHFIRTIGIYPVGTLVKLESGYLAVVVEQHHEDLLHPKVRAVFNSRTHSHIPPKDFDLSKPGGDRIVSFEVPSRWHIDPSRHI